MSAVGRDRCSTVSGCDDRGHSQRFAAIRRKGIIREHIQNVIHTTDRQSDRICGSGWRIIHRLNSHCDGRCGGIRTVTNGVSKSIFPVEIGSWCVDHGLTTRADRDVTAPG